MRRYLHYLVLALAVTSFIGGASCKRADDSENAKTAGQKPASSEKAASEPANPDANNAPVKADTDLDSILTKYFNAIGGPAKWNDIKTLKYTGKMDSMGKLFQMAIVYKRPDKCRIDFSLGHIYFIQSYDGKDAWKFNPTTEGSAPELLKGNDAEDLKETCDFDGPLIDYKQKGHKLELMGMEKINGREAYKIKVSFKSGNVDYYYLDTKTYLPFLVKGTTKVKDKEVPSSTTIDQYIDTGGVIIPYYFKFDIKDGEGAEEITVSTVEINPKLDDSVFTFPRRIEDSY
jgi:outer membrane lipoprotein-sorting protein